MRHYETVEEFTARARRLTEAAAREGGDTQNQHSHFCRCMAEAKSRRMTWVEGLQYTIDQAKVFLERAGE
jgi:hypothetical protein